MARTLQIPISSFFDNRSSQTEVATGGKRARRTTSLNSLTTTDGMALTKAFMLIKDKRLGSNRCRARLTGGKRPPIKSLGETQYLVTAVLAEQSRIRE